MKRSAVIIISFLAFVIVAGCASSPSRFYTLNPTAVPVAEQSAGCSVSVGPVSVPAAVDRLQIVVQTEPNQVYISEFDRWASPLKGDIARVVAANLSSLLGTPQVTVFPTATAADASYRVIIDVMRFDSELNKAATLDALWTVSVMKNGQTQRSRTTVSEPVQGSDYVAIAAAHSRALGKMSAGIAATISEMEKKAR